jgi:hypothetical protein
MRQNQVLDVGIPGDLSRHRRKHVQTPLNSQQVNKISQAATFSSHSLQIEWHFLPPHPRMLALARLPHQIAARSSLVLQFWPSKTQHLHRDALRSARLRRSRWQQCATQEKNNQLQRAYDGEKSGHEVTSSWAVQCEWHGAILKRSLAYFYESSCGPASASLGTFLGVFVSSIQQFDFPQGLSS